MPNAQPSLGEQMASPTVRHSLSWREEESAHVMPEGRLSAAANDDEVRAAICSSSNRALVEGFMVLVGCFLESCTYPILHVCLEGIMRSVQHKETV